MVARVVLLLAALIVTYQSVAVWLEAWPPITGLHERFGWRLLVVSVPVVVLVAGWAVVHLGRAALR